MTADARRNRRAALATLILATSTLISTSCSNSSPAGGGATPPAGDGATAGVKMPASTSAAAIIARARRIQPAPSPISAPRLPKGRQPATARAAVIASSSAEARVVGATIQALVPTRKAATVDVAYPTRAQQSRALKLSSGASLSLALRDATDAPAEYANGYLVYESGTRGGAHVIVRPSENGFEDYIFFEKKPDATRVEYDLTLPPAVAGLRLSSNILEVVGADGLPLFHASSPFLVDAAGKRTNAKLSIGGCAFDDSTQPTWKRKPTAPGATSCKVSITWDDTNVRYPAVLDPIWESAAAMPVVMGFSNSEVLAGRSPQQVVVFGFTDNVALLKTTLFFDVDSGTWSVGPPTVVARGSGSAVAFNDAKTNDGAKVFVSGGYSLAADGTPTYESSTEILSLNASGQWAWTSSSPMQAARFTHTATAIPTPTGTQILLAGGLGNGPYASGCDPGPTASTAELYDTATGSFVSPAPPNMPTKLFEATAGLSADGQAVIIMGGYNGGVDQPVDYCSGSTMVLAFRGGQWLTLPSTPTYRLGPQVVQLNDSRFLVTAGSGYTDATQQTCTWKAQTEIFTFSPTPPYGSWTTADPVPTAGAGPLGALPNGAVMFGPIATDTSCDTPPTPTTQVDLFDPKTGHWSRASDTSVPHYGGGRASVTKTTGEQEAVIFGGSTAYDPASGWTDTAVTEVFALTAAGGACTVGSECVTGICLGSLCQPPGFPITIDATALSNKGVSIPGVLNGAAVDTTQPRPLNLAAGTYNVQTVSGVASVATFTVGSDGNIAYDPSLEGVLSGAGGTKLTIKGRQIVVDATHLSQPQLQIVAYNFSQGAEADRLTFPTNPAQTLVLLPLSGYGYQFAGDSAIDSLAFGLDLQGNVHIPPAQAYLASGDGTPKLTITGAQVTVSVPSGFGSATLGGVALPEGQTTTVFLLPAPGTPMPLTFGSLTSNITVDDSGNIFGNPTLISILDIHGAGPSACGTQNSLAAAGGWNATPLVCGGATVEDADGIEAATPAVTPAARLGGAGRFPNELPRFRKAAGGDPVMGDGEFSIQRTDIAYPGKGMRYEFTRSYRSGLELDSPLGSGWDHNYDQRVIGKPVFDPYDDAKLPFAGDVIAPFCDNTVQVQDGAGSLVLFRSKGWFWVVPGGQLLLSGHDDGVRRPLPALRQPDQRAHARLLPVDLRRQSVVLDDAPQRRLDGDGVRLRRLPLLDDQRRRQRHHLPVGARHRRALSRLRQPHAAAVRVRSRALAQRADALARRPAAAAPVGDRSVPPRLLPLHDVVDLPEQPARLHQPLLGRHQLLVPARQLSVERRPLRRRHARRRHDHGDRDLPLSSGCDRRELPGEQRHPQLLLAAVRVADGRLHGRRLSVAGAQPLSEPDLHGARARPELRRVAPHLQGQQDSRTHALLRGRAGRRSDPVHRLHVRWAELP